MQLFDLVRADLRNARTRRAQGSAVSLARRSPRGLRLRASSGGVASGNGLRSVLCYPSHSRHAACTQPETAMLEAIRRKFNEGWYAARYKTFLKDFDGTPFDYYMAQGWRLGHDPHADFSELFYRAEYDDVAQALHGRRLLQRLSSLSAARHRRGPTRGPQGAPWAPVLRAGLLPYRLRLSRGAASHRSRALPVDLRFLFHRIAPHRHRSQSALFRARLPLFPPRRGRGEKKPRSDRRLRIRPFPHHRAGRGSQDLQRQRVRASRRAPGGRGQQAGAGKKSAADHPSSRNRVHQAHPRSTSTASTSRPARRAATVSR